ncbi:MAG: hypothetical protein MUO42_02845 [Anaerolineaceae bacterium]|jgi:hypothetical protein|nr:hypothetical protein [Anaerolineaceae bacterium]
MIKPNSSTLNSQHPLKNQELSRILSAAVVNSHFRSILLSDPISAIANGYSGESFSLGEKEQERLGSIRANSLADFAAQLSTV